MKRCHGATVSLFERACVCRDAFDAFRLRHLLLGLARCFHRRVAMVDRWCRRPWLDGAESLYLRVGAVSRTRLVLVPRDACNAESVVVLRPLKVAVLFEDMLALGNRRRRWLCFAEFGCLCRGARVVLQDACVEGNALGAKSFVVPVVPAQQFFLTCALFFRRWCWWCCFAEVNDVGGGATDLGEVGLVRIGARDAGFALGIFAAVRNEIFGAGSGWWMWMWVGRSRWCNLAEGCFFGRSAA